MLLYSDVWFKQLMVEVQVLFKSGFYLEASKGLVVPQSYQFLITVTSHRLMQQHSVFWPSLHSTFVFMELFYTNFLLILQS